MTNRLFKRVRKNKITTIFRKEIREILKNKEILITIIIMPIVFSLLVPASMIALSLTDQSDISETDQAPDIFRNMTPYWDELNDLQKITILQANFYLAFLIMIPMIVPMAISSDSIAGEKERKTIEVLLASPVSEEEILLGKALAAAVPSIIISWVAEIIYIIFTNIVVFGIMGRIVLPNIFAGIMFLFLIPTQTFLSTLLMTSISSRSRGAREALQKSGLIVTPYLLIISAIIFVPLLVHPLLTLASWFVLVLLTFLTLKITTKTFKRDKLLSL
ncbi:MAG: ABC transporter permease subunit [Candidatus Heimdallarchaeota archaeon]